MGTDATGEGYGPHAKDPPPLSRRAPQAIWDALTKGRWPRTGRRLSPSYVPQLWRAQFGPGGVLGGIPYVPINRMRATYSTLAQSAGVDPMLINAIQGRSVGSEVLYSNYLNPDMSAYAAAAERGGGRLAGGDPWAPAPLTRRASTAAPPRAQARSGPYGFIRHAPEVGCRKTSQPSGMAPSHQPAIAAPPRVRFGQVTISRHEKEVGAL